MVRLLTYLIKDFLPKFVHSGKTDAKNKLILSETLQFSCFKSKEYLVDLRYLKPKWYTVEMGPHYTKVYKRRYMLSAHQVQISMVIFFNDKFSDPYAKENKEEGSLLS